MYDASITSCIKLITCISKVRMKQFIQIELNVTNYGNPFNTDTA